VTNGTVQFAFTPSKFKNEEKATYFYDWLGFDMQVHSKLAIAIMS